ncbi:MAG TPA: class I SAM-dependent methyltransferase, partial [Vicinamibacterales bacterium]|nr:class I SAM-dependent methyltransferase [Vicinamibacterales bacterium]
SPLVAASQPLPFSSMSERDWRRAVQLWRAHAPALLAELPKRGCPACGADQSRWLFDSYDLHPYHECDVCGCWFVPRHVDWAVFDRLFERSPEAAAHAEQMMGYRDADSGRESDMARIGGYLDDLLPLLPVERESVAYLDAGCGVGHSLRAGLERGFRVQGVEVDVAALALVRAAGLPVVTPDQDVPGAPYHLLSFWETLEHITNPLATIQQYLPLLAEDGLVAITVPNLNALATRVLRESCPWIHGGYNTPGHVNMFHAESIGRLLDRAGLTLLDADGQFSANPLELLAVLAGASRGAFDTLDDHAPRQALPQTAADLLSALWPGAALIERVALASPILRVIACRKGQEQRFAPELSALRDRRRAEIETTANALLAEEVDYKPISEELQREINRRDDLLRTTTASMQDEINRRDSLLEQERDRYARSIDGRLRALGRKVGRLIGSRQ